jgi:hypothetical protein
MSVTSMTDGLIHVKATTDSSVFFWLRAFYGIFKIKRFASYWYLPLLRTAQVVSGCLRLSQVVSGIYVLI